MKHYARCGAPTVPGVLFWLTVAALCALDPWLPHPAGVSRAEFGTTPAGALLSIGAGLVNLFSGKIDKNVKRALDGMRLTLAVAFETVAGFMKETGQKQSGVVGILRRFWDAALLPLIKKIDGKINRLYAWLKDTFGPIVSALLWLRKHVIDFYGKWFKPIFDTIDAVRGILRVLGVLHLDVARKLDEKLARLEARILAPLRVALETINTLIDWTERVIDGNGFFQRYTFLRSQVKYARASWNELLHPQLKGVDDVDIEGLRQRTYRVISAHELGSQLAEFQRSGGGELAPVISEVVLEAGALAAR